jgi:predicted NUDIX family NTP pyrophosphohydrolase
MGAISAGCLVTREGTAGLEVLLVHPRRASFQRPLFGIPKGLVEKGEGLEQAAVRETLEETGLRVRVRSSLGNTKQKSGKLVYAFWASVESESTGEIDEAGRCRHPDWENDVCRFYPLDQAAQLMIPAQRVFLERLSGRPAD